MKKFNFIFAIAMMVVAAASVAVVSCKKDTENAKSENPICEVSPIDDMGEYLTAFRSKLLSAQKGDETLTLEQAQRDFGNLLNFDFGDAGHDSNVFQCDTIHTTLITSDRQVDLAQLANTYRIACKQIEKAFEQVNLPEKSVYTVYCRFEQENNFSDTVDVTIVLTTRGLDNTSKGMCTVSPSKSSIDPTDCWTIDFEQGRCNGTDVGYDHVDILKLVYKNSHILPLACTGHLFYTEAGNKTFHATSFPETGSQFYNYGFKLWAGTYNDWHDGYAVPAEMSYYFNNLCDIIDNYMDSLDNNNLVVNKITCGIEYSRLNWYHFVWTINYGVPNCSGAFD